MTKLTELWEVQLRAAHSMVTGHTPRRLWVVIEETYFAQIVTQFRVKRSTSSSISYGPATHKLQEYWPPDEGTELIDKWCSIAKIHLYFRTRSPVQILTVGMRVISSTPILQ
jgi:hypothetical protein